MIELHISSAFTEASNLDFVNVQQVQTKPQAAALEDHIHASLVFASLRIVRIVTKWLK